MHGTHTQIKHSQRSLFIALILSANSEKSTRDVGKGKWEHEGHENTKGTKGKG